MLRIHLWIGIATFGWAGCVASDVATAPEPSFEFSDDQDTAVVRSEAGDRYDLTLGATGQLGISTAGAEFLFPSSDNLTFGINAAGDELSLSVVDDQVTVRVTDETGTPATFEFADPNGQVRNFMEAFINPEPEFTAALSRSDCQSMDNTLRFMCDQLMDYSPATIQALVEFLLANGSQDLSRFLPVANRVIENHYHRLPEFCDAFLDIDKPCETALAEFVE